MTNTEIIMGNMVMLIADGIITSDRFDIHERIDDSLNPYLEATDMLFYMLREPNKVVRLKEKQRLKRKLKKSKVFVS